MKTIRGVLLYVCVFIYTTASLRINVGKPLRSHQLLCPSVELVSCNLYQRSDVRERRRTMAPKMCQTVSGEFRTIFGQLFHRYRLPHSLPVLVDYKDRPSPLRRALETIRAFISKLASWLGRCLRMSNSIRTGSSHNELPSVPNAGSEFLSLSSVPINQMPSLAAGRQYAQAKLQEIESYLTRKRDSSGPQRKYSGIDRAASFNRLMGGGKRSVEDLTDEEIKNKR